jgi:hypothetical protein
MDLRVEIGDGAFVVDAALLGHLLNIAPADIPALMRERAITSVCEQGIADDDGEFRLSFFYRNRRVTLTMDLSGHVFRHSISDRRVRPMGDPMPLWNPSETN